MSQWKTKQTDGLANETPFHCSIIPRLRLPYRIRVV